MSRNPTNQNGLNKLSEGEIGWLAGLYEGEGYCGLLGHAYFTVSITMTDLDVIDRIYDVTGIGTVLGPYDRGNKPYKTWRVGSQEGVEFLETILPWLGKRRSERVQTAIERWNSSTKKQTRRGDTHCVHGHEFTPDNTYKTYSGNGRGCKICRQAALEKYRAKKRNDPVWVAKKREQSREYYRRQKESR